MDSEYLRNKYAELSDSELLLIVNENSKDYTDEAIIIAKEEIEKRTLSGEIKEKVSEDSEVIYIENNITSTVLKFIGVIEIIIGSFISLIILFTNNFLTGIVIIISEFVIGLLFIGFGEIINLLHQINERQKML